MENLEELITIKFMDFWEKMDLSKFFPYLGL